MYNLENLIKGVPVPEPLQDAVIFGTNASSSERKMELTVVSEDIISYEIIEDYKKAVSSKYSLSEFILRVKYENISIDDIDIDLYYKNLVFYVNEIIGGVRHLFLNSRAEYTDGRLLIHCMYGVDMLRSLDCANTIKRLVKAQLKADIEVEFLDEMDTERLEKLREEALRSIAIEPPPSPPEQKPQEEESNVIHGKDISSEEATDIVKITDEPKQVVIGGEILTLDFRELKSEKTLMTFVLADRTGAYSCKTFLSKAGAKKVKASVKKGMAVKVKGQVQYDTYAKENVIMANSIVPHKLKGRCDDASESRIVAMSFCEPRSCGSALSS